MYREKKDTILIFSERKLTVRGLLGSGSFAKVYLAEDTSGMQYALKISADRTLLRNEATYMRLSLSDLFPIFYDYREDEETGCLLMEYIEGNSPLTAESPETAETAAAFAANLGMQIAEELLKLQEREPRLLVRDIKPDNMLITKEGRVRLLDLGLMCEAGKTNAKAGSPGFAAPEQFVPGSVLDISADLYGIGKSMEAVWTAGTLGSGSGPRQFRKIISWFTEKERDRRIPDYQTALAVLKRYLAEGENMKWSRAERDCLTGKIRWEKTIAVF